MNKMRNQSTKVHENHTSFLHMVVLTGYSYKQRKTWILLNPTVELFSTIIFILTSGDVS